MTDLSVLLRGCIPQLGTTLALSVGSGFLDIVCMVALSSFLLTALSAGAHALPGAGFLPEMTLPQFTAAIIALFVFRAAYLLLAGASLAHLAESVRERIVGRMVRGFAGRSYQDAITLSVATGLTAVMSHSHTFALFVALPLLRLIQDLLTIVVVLTFVALLEPRLVAVVLVVLMGVAVVYYVSIRRISDDKSRQLASLERELTQDVSQVLNAPRVVRVFGLADYFVNRIGGVMAARTRARAWLGAVYWFPRALGELTLIGLAVAYMVIRAQSGANTGLVISNLSVLAFAGLRLLPAFSQTMVNLAYLRSGRPVSTLLADELRQFEGGAPVMAVEPAPGPAFQAPFESVELRNVSFAYEVAKDAALQDISLVIRQGQSVGIVGPSGAGKSTLGDLLLGLLPPTSGETLLNGSPADLCGAAWWRKVGFVPQAPYIGNESMRTNIAFGEPAGKVDEVRLAAAIRAARLEDVVAQLPRGLDTQLGDHGARLSGGQRQRVAIARALYRQREFLVLDEATSALDSETEREVIAAIAALKGTVTTFIIAHRLSTLESCDFVVELRGGRLHPVAVAAGESSA